MEKEYFVKWNNGKDRSEEGSYGGTLKVEIYTLDRFSIEKVSGSSIPTKELIRLLWSSQIFKDLRNYVSSLKRKNTWNVQTRCGMSGCLDAWIQFLDSGTFSVRRGRKAFHSSMMGCFNEDIHDIWSKDFFDLLWWFKQNGHFKEAFEDDSSFKFFDVTNEYIDRREEFFKSSYEPGNGFGGDEPFDEDKLWDDQTHSTEEKEEIVDYSEYRPSDEIASIDQDCPDEMFDK